MGQLLIATVLNEAAIAAPTRIGFTLGEASLTFKAALHRAQSAAKALIQLGIKPGDVIVWWSSADLRCIDGFYAAASCGAIYCPLDPNAPHETISNVFDYLSPSLIVADTQRAPFAKSWAEINAVTLIVLGQETTQGFSEDLGEISPFDETTALVHPSQIKEDDPHILYLTSGTTGMPKAVAVSHRASWLRAAPGGGAFCEPFSGSGGLSTCFPLFHYAGWHYVIEAGLLRIPVHLVRNASAEELLTTIERWRPSAFYAIPAVWERILDPTHNKRDLTSLRRADTGTSPTSSDLLARIKERVPNARISVLYGSTEGGHTTTLPHEFITAKPNSVGRAAPPSTLRISDDGELLVRSLTLMNEYWRLPEQTAEVLEDGWYRSGDLVYIDTEGFVYITGRRREVIRSGGETIIPVDVERVLLEHPSIKECAVVGVDDKSFGEIVTAVVVLHPQASLPAVSTLRQFLEGKIASPAHPRRIVGASFLPRTAATGQLQRQKIKQVVTNSRATETFVDF
jgi:fatty-acyl-CoA synthase